MSVDEYKAKGNAAFKNGDWETAVAEFTRALDLDPSNHILFSNRSAAYAGKGDFTSALNDAEKTVSLKSDWAKGYARKGAALHGLRKYEEAIAAYDAGLKIEPGNALLTKGRQDVEDEQATGGADGMGNAIANLFGPDVLAKMAANPKLAPFLAQPDLIAKIKQIQQNPQLVNMYMQSDTRLMQVMMGLMGLDATVGSRPGGEDDDASPYTATPSSPPKAQAKPAPKAEPVVELTEEEKAAAAKREASNAEKDVGNTHYKAREFEQALAAYEKAYGLDDTNIAVLTNKAAVQMEMGDYQASIATCEQAIERGREVRADFKVLARAMGRIGNAYVKLEDYENAIKWYNKSLSEHRTADVLTRLREIEKIKKEADARAYIDPAKADEAREKGNQLFKDSDFSGAVPFYSEAIRRNPSDPRNYSNRAACYIKLMAFTEADKDCDAAIALDEGFVKAYIRKAAILFAKRDYTASLEMCETAKAKDADGKHEAEITQQRYKAYAALNEVQSGANAAENLKRAQDDPEVQRVLADPIMQTILRQMQEDPRAIQDHMKNPEVAKKMRILMNAGIIQMR